MEIILTRIVWFLVSIIVLVVVHEYGHFIVARLCGVKVLRFSVGFGRRLFSWYDRKGTEFALSVIPLGGYVKMLDEREMEVGESERHLSFNAQHPFKKIAIASAGPIANILLAILFFWVILFFRGSWSAAPIVGDIEEESAVAKAGLVEGQEIVAIDGLYTSGSYDIFVALYKRVGETGDILFTLKYPNSDLEYDSNVRIDNWLYGERNPEVMKSLGLKLKRPPAGLKIAEVGKDSAAELAGFKPGDEIKSVNGEAVADGDEWSAFVRAHPGEKIDIGVERESVDTLLELVPSIKTAKDGTRYGFAGVSLPYPKDLVRYKNYGVFSALSGAVKQMFETIDVIVMSIKKLFAGELSVNNLSGPPGIAKVAADSAEAGMWAFFGFLATLSVYLGVFNLLPVPVLDGGHIVYSLIEWVKGGPIPEKIQLWGVQAGMAMLLCVVVVATYYDFFG